MVTAIMILGIITYSLFALTFIFLILLRTLKKRIFYKLHRAIAIVAICLATAHGIIAAFYFRGLI
jgi:DMSO/TMAO reductase YedYZ heme-binding membrane subunit